MSENEVITLSEREIAIRDTAAAYSQASHSYNQQLTQCVVLRNYTDIDRPHGFSLKALPPEAVRIIDVIDEHKRELKELLNAQLQQSFAESLAANRNFVQALGLKVVSPGDDKHEPTVEIPHRDGGEMVGTIRRINYLHFDDATGALIDCRITLTSRSITDTYDLTIVNGNAYVSDDVDMY